MQTVAPAHAAHPATAAHHDSHAGTRHYMVGIFDDEEVLLDAIEKIRATGTKIHDVFTPFPIHGIDDVLGIQRTRLPIAAFMYGCCGLSFALFMQIYMLWADWPIIIGGKPHFSFPAMVPVSFELTVLCTAFGMVGTFLLVSRLRPRFKTVVFDRRATDDKFVMAIEVHEEAERKHLTDLLRQHGASEVNEKEIAKKR